MAADALFSEVHQVFVFVSLLRQQQRMQVVWISLFSDAHAYMIFSAYNLGPKQCCFSGAALHGFCECPYMSFLFLPLLIKVNRERVIVLTAIPVPKFRHQFHQNKIRNTYLVFMSICIDVLLISW